MGDIAEAMIDGLMCQVCGIFMHESVGYPRTCQDCGGDFAGVPVKKKRKKKKKPNQPAKDAAK